MKNILIVILSLAYATVRISIFFIWKLFSYQRVKIDIHHKTLGQVLIPGQASDRQVRNIIYHFEKFKPFL